MDTAKLTSGLAHLLPHRGDREEFQSQTRLVEVLGKETLGPCPGVRDRSRGRGDRGGTSTGRSRVVVGGPVVTGVSLVTSVRGPTLWNPFRKTGLGGPEVVVLSPPLWTDRIPTS